MSFLKEEADIREGDYFEWKGEDYKLTDIDIESEDAILEDEDGNEKRVGLESLVRRNYQESYDLYEMPKEKGQSKLSEEDVKAVRTQAKEMASKDWDSDEVKSDKELHDFFDSYSDDEEEWQYFKEAYKNEVKTYKELEDSDKETQENLNKEESSKSSLNGKKVSVRLARKPSDLTEVKNESLYLGDEDVKISETIDLSEEDYNKLTKYPLRDYDFLKGKGGYDDDGNRTAVAVRSKGKQTLVIDPSGSAYARYMGILYADEGAKDSKLDTAQQEKVGVVMKEFKEGELKSGSGKKVTDPKQAIAIALSEAGKAKDEKEIPDEQEKPEKAGEENALVKGEEEMTEEVKEALAEKEVEKVKEAEDACGKAKDEKDEKLESKKDFAEGVKYGEEKEKEEPKKLDSEHESEGAKKADEEEAKKKKEAEDEDKEEKKEDKMAKDSALAMDVDAIKQAVREEMKADFKAREDARKAVRSIVGDVNVMTFDSAEDIYKFACEQASMDVNDIVSYKDAFKGLTAGKSKLALDASSISGSNEECFADIRIA